MSLTYRWYDDEETIIFIEMSDGWNWRDYHEMLTHINALMDNALDPVHWVLDISQQSEIPINTMQHVPRILGQIHPKRGYVMVVGANRLILGLWSVLAAVYRQLSSATYHFVDDVADAIAALEDLVSDMES